MKIHNEQITFQSQKARETFNITRQVKAAMEKSGFGEGIILVASLHARSAVIVHDDEAALKVELESWELGEAAQTGAGAAGAGGLPAGLLGLLLQHQVVVPFGEGRLELGGDEAIVFVELDGLRPRRITVKVIGE